MQLHLGPHRYAAERPPLVMGVLNRTTDSFYDRGAYFELDAMLTRAETLVSDGADVLDVGARLGGVGTRDVSVDETHLMCDANASGAAASRSRAVYEDVVVNVAAALADLAARAVGVGLQAERVLVDPELDLGKGWQQSVRLLAETQRFADLGHPVLGAPSNKISRVHEPRCVVTIEDALQPVVVDGEAAVIVEQPALGRFLDALNTKYWVDYGPEFLDPQINATVCVHPASVLALHEAHFVSSPTRWQLRFP